MFQIYEMFNQFCKVPQLRAAVCTALLNQPPAERRLTTPIMSACTTAALSDDEAIRPEIPHNAIRLLTHVVKVSHTTF